MISVSIKYPITFVDKGVLLQLHLMGQMPVISPEFLHSRETISRAWESTGFSLLFVKIFGYTNIQSTKNCISVFFTEP
jgi:hypothetical protein